MKIISESAGGQINHEVQKIMDALNEIRSQIL